MSDNLVSDDKALLEYSVVYTDRSLNHMSAKFQGVMKDLHASLCSAYHAESAILVPGGGTYAMEAVARQFAQKKNCLVVRNGWFSYRWSQILERGEIASKVRVLKAKPTSEAKQAPYTPPPLDALVSQIQSEKPDILFAPHVETASGIMLSNDYIRILADAMHEHGGIFVLDCIASGSIWVDMASSGVDVLISAPQKGWSASPCAGVVLLNKRMRDLIGSTTSNSFACDLLQWSNIMNAYLNGGHAYHATMPTDGLVVFRDTIKEMEAIGLDVLRENQQRLGDQVRALLAEKGFKSVAAPEFAAPGVVVSYTDDDKIKNGEKFSSLGIQIAAGVPLQCEEGTDFKTFRIGLFGIDKLMNVERTVGRLCEALESI